MIPLLVSADAEQAVIDELKSAYIIGTAIPTTPPKTFLRVVGGGGFQRDLVTDSVTVILEAFAVKETDAQRALARAVALIQRGQTLTSKVGTATCYRVQVAGLPANLPLTTLPTHKRYTTTLVLDLRRLSVA